MAANESGRSIEVRVKQPSNALAASVVMGLGITSEVKWAQDLKALALIAVTVESTVTAPPLPKYPIRVVLVESE